MTTTIAGTVIEGVDNDVLLAFIVLMVITLSTIIYFLNLNGNLTSTLGDSWLYLRNSLASLNQESVDDQSSSGIVQEDVNSGQNASVSEDSHQNEQTAPATEQESGLSDTGAGMENSERNETEEVQERPKSNLPGSSQAENGDGLRNRTEFRAATPQAGNDNNSASQFSIRVKHHEIERSFIVEPSLTVGELKRLTFPDEVAQGRRVRFIYSGRLLNDDSASISFYGISNYSVVHAQISDAPQHNSPLGQEDEDIEIDMSRLFIPVLTLILCGCWYGLMTYRQLFDTTSTAILVIITGAYAFMIFVMFY